MLRPEEFSFEFGGLLCTEDHSPLYRKAKLENKKIIKITIYRYLLYKYFLNLFPLDLQI